jgi:hypothetical protein
MLCLWFLPIERITRFSCCRSLDTNAGQTTRDILRDKHPLGKSPNPNQLGCIICGDGVREGTTQGDPLAMTIIVNLSLPNVNQVWYADDDAGAGSCEDLIKVIGIAYDSLIWLQP